MADLTRKLVSDLSGCLERAIDERGHATVVVSGGRTPEHLFPVLARQSLAWDRVFITLADERWVDVGHPDSNEGLARALLLQGPASKAQFIGLKTDPADPLDGRMECEASVAQLSWPLDVIFLGMGEDGHIASLFPGSDDWLGAPGRVVAVAASKNRHPRMSLTPGALLDSRHIFLVISGPAKQATFEAALKPGPVGQLPVRLILHQTQVPVTVYTVD